jgi:hypothetical protein
VESFLKTIGLIEGEAFVPADFPEQHPVSAEEAATFDAAVNGYPMLNAKATSVASRTVIDGTEYLFTAMDKPREAKADMPRGRQFPYASIPYPTSLQKTDSVE